MSLKLLFIIELCMETTCDVWTGGIIGEPQRLDVVR